MPDDQSRMTEATAEDRAALARCSECWEDHERADISRDAMNRLEDLGWIEEVGDREWEITRKGVAVLETANAR